MMTIEQIRIQKRSNFEQALELFAEFQMCRQALVPVGCSSHVEFFRQEAEKEVQSKLSKLGYVALRLNGREILAQVCVQTFFH